MNIQTPAALMSQNVSFYVYPPVGLKIFITNNKMNKWLKYAEDEKL